MDELTIAYCYAHLWLHAFKPRTAFERCPFCEGTRPAKQRYGKRERTA